MTDRSASFGINNITAMVADPSSNYVYLSTSTGFVYKWNSNTGATAASSQVGTNISALALSPDGSYLMAGESNGTPDQPTRFEKVATSDLSYTSVQVPVFTTYPASALEPYRYGVAHVVITGGGVVYNSEYSLSGFENTYKFSLNNPASSANYGPYTSDSAPLILSESGRYILAADSSVSPSDITLYDIQSNTTVTTSFNSLPGSPSQLAISDAAGLIAASDGRLQVFDLTFHQVADLSASLGTSYAAAGLAFMPGGHQLLVWDDVSNLLRVFDTQSWAQVGTFAMPAFIASGQSNVPSIAIGDNGQFLYLGGNRASIDLVANMSLTINGSQAHPVLYGSVGNDTLIGGAENDTLFGSGGNDTLTGGGGADTFVFAPGIGATAVTDFSDSQGDKIDLTALANIHGMPDLQAVSTQSGANTVITLGSGQLTLDNIQLSSLTANDFLFNHTYYGGGGTIVGDGANDTIYGGAGNYSVYGGGGNVTIYAGGGNDVMVAGSGSFTAYGGTGSDYFYGGSHGDVAYGGAGGVNVFVMGSGNDQVFGGSYYSYIFGGGGNDTFHAGTGVNVINETSAGSNIIYGQGTVDYLYGGAGTDTIYGGSGETILVMGGGNSTYYGGSGTTYYYGGNGNNAYYGGSGIDVIVGGQGHDTFNGGGNVNYFFLGASAHDTVQMNANVAGVDVVHNFDPAKDLVQVLNTGWSSLSDVLAHTYDYSASAGFIDIALNGQAAIWLIGVTPSQLTPSDFHFA